MLNARISRDSKQAMNRRIAQLKKLQKLEVKITGIKETLAALEQKHDSLFARLSVTEEFKRIRTVGSSGVQYNWN